MTLIQIRINSKNKVHDTRNLDYFLNTDKFVRAFELANDVSYDLIIDHVSNSNLKFLKIRFYL